MGYSAIPNIHIQLKQTYAKLITPYEDFLQHVKNSPTLTPGGSGKTYTGGPPDSPSIARTTSIGARGAPLTMVDHTLERQAKMGNGVVGDENRMARTRGDRQKNNDKDTTMTDVFRTNGSDKPKSRSQTAAAGKLIIFWNDVVETHDMHSGGCSCCG
jgi:hypothetical protein